MSTPVTVVTTWSARQAETYGRAWLDGGDRFWPLTWRRVVYGQRPRLFDDTNVEFRPERTAEVDALAPPHVLESAGRVAKGCWTSKERQGGYSFRTDARRFAWKAFALLDAARRQETGILVWLDADVRTHARPPEELWRTLLDGAQVSWLDRSPVYPETGCVIFRLPCAAFFEDYRRQYQDRLLFNLPQWHDAYVFHTIVSNDPLRAWRPYHHGNWETSPLAPYLIHEKGFVRKQIAYGETPCLTGS